MAVGAGGPRRPHFWVLADFSYMSPDRLTVYRGQLFNFLKC